MSSNEDLDERLEIANKALQDYLETGSFDIPNDDDTWWGVLRQTFNKHRSAYEALCVEETTRTALRCRKNVEQVGPDPLARRHSIHMAATTASINVCLRPEISARIGNAWLTVFSDVEGFREHLLEYVENSIGERLKEYKDVR